MQERYAKDYFFGGSPLKLENTTKHPFFAAIIDLYLSEMFLTILIGLISFLIMGPVPDWLYFSLGPLIFIIVVLYHIGFLRVGTGFTSVGEKATGKILIKNKIEWINPYGINRGGLFVLYILVLLLFKDSSNVINIRFDWIFVLVLVIKFIVITSTFVLVGKGNLRGIFIIFSFLIIFGGLQIILNSNTIQILGVTFLIIAIYSLILFFYYSRKRIKEE
jgi:hypothetical protein